MYPKILIVSTIGNSMIAPHLTLRDEVGHLLPLLFLAVDDLDGNFGAVPDAFVDLSKSSFTQNFFLFIKGFSFRSVSCLRHSPKFQTDIFW